MTRDQIEAWLALEGWVPWQATYDETRFGIRQDDTFWFAGGLTDSMLPTEVDGDTRNGMRDKERSIAWSDFPMDSLVAIYNRVKAVS